MTSAFSTPGSAASPQMVDWDLAVRLGSRMAGEGPEVSREHAHEVVSELRAGAERSTGLVADFTGLDAPRNTAPVLVVDRPGWVQANADGFQTILSPIIEKLTAKKPPGAVALAIGSKVTGAEVGGLLGFLGSKVLGQFDPFYAPAGRLLLVAPNIVHIERELQAEPHDFRLWVCLHEETHRVQFTAVPWMRDHLFGEVGKLADTVDPNVVEQGLSRVFEALKSGTRGGSLIDVLGSPEQKALVDRLTGMMSLLEGHADVVMDGVGPTVIPSVATIRKAFDKRRGGVGVLDKLLRRLLGLEAKMAQYRDGAKFVRAVVRKAGMEEFNAVWERADNLPSKAEIEQPDLWMSRVL